MKKLKVFVLSAFTSIFIISCGKSVPSNPDEYLHKIVNSEVQKTTSNLSRLQNLYSKALQNKDYEANEQSKLPPAEPVALIRHKWPATSCGKPLRNASHRDF